MLRLYFLAIALCCASPAAFGAQANVHTGVHTGVQAGIQTAPLTHTQAEVLARTRMFLDAYAAGDQAKVMRMLDPEVRVYGSDAAELFEGPEAVRTLLDEDQKLWGGAATIGSPEHVNVVSGPELQTIFFDAPFTVGKRPAVRVRFALVWRRHGTGWLLAMSSNTVPTTGQSAAELLRGASGGR